MGFLKVFTGVTPNPCGNVFTYDDNTIDTLSESEYLRDYKYYEILYPRSVPLEPFITKVSCLEQSTLDLIKPIFMD